MENKQTNPNDQLNSDKNDKTTAQHDNPSKHQSKKMLILGIMVLLGLVFGTAGWVYYARQNNTEPTTSNEENVEQPSAVEFSDNALLFQVDTNLIAFDPATKQEVVVTGNIPKGATILDAFVNDGEWAVYYEVHENNEEFEYSAYLLEKGEEPKKIVGAIGEAYVTAANAEQKVLVYSDLPDIGEDLSPENNKTRTYIVNGTDSPELVHSSYEQEVEAASDDPKNHLFYLDDISSDGTELLFGLRSCYQCDGPPLATAFRLNIETQKADIVFHEEDVSGQFSYSDEDTIILEKYVNFSFIGEVEGPIDVQVFELTSPSFTPALVAKVVSSEWSSLYFTANHRTIGVNAKGATYTEDFSQEFEGLYMAPEAGVTDVVGEWENLEITNLPGNAKELLELGERKDSCLSVVFHSGYGAGTDTREVYIGALCENEDGSYAYITVDQLLIKPTESNPPIASVSL